jgi:hypothetical protein
LLGSEPLLFLLRGAEPVLLVLVGFTTTALIQLIVSIGLDHGEPLWELLGLRGEYFRWADLAQKI